MTEYDETKAREFWAQKKSETLQEAGFKPTVTSTQFAPQDETGNLAPSLSNEQAREFWSQEKAKTFGETRAPDQSFQKTSSKFATSSKKFPPNKRFTKLSEKEKAEAYFDLYDTNLELKKNHSKLESEIKTLKTALNRVSNEVKYERSMAESLTGADFKSRFIEGTDSQVKQENQKLKQEIKTLKNLASKGRQKAQKSNVGPYLRKHKMQPEVMTDEVKYEIYKKGIPKSQTVQSDVTVADVTQLRMSNSSLQTMVEDLQSQLKEERTHHQQAKTRVMELESELRIRKMNEGSSELQQRNQELLEENKRLEIQLREALRSPFGQPTSRSYLQTELDKKVNSLEDAKKRINELESRIGSLQEEVRSLTIEKESLTEENLRLKVRLEEKNRMMTDFEDQMKTLGGRDADSFLKALGMMKLRGETPAWCKMDFLERYEDSSDPNKEVERLKIEKGELAAELEKVQNLMTLKNEMEKEREAIYKSEVEQYKMQLKAAQQRTQELARLADFRANRVLQLERNQRLNTYDEANRITATATSVNVASFENSAPEFIEGGTEVDSGENILDLWIGEGEFYQYSLESILKSLVLNESSMVSFLTIDFFKHETQSTSLAEGLNPNYNIHISFKVTADDYFLRFLENGSVKLEAHAMKGDSHITFAKAEVPLKELVNRPSAVSEANTRTTVVESAASFVSYFDNKSSLGIFRYKLRMRYPLKEALRWYREKQEVVELTHPQQYALQTVYSQETPKQRTLVVNVFRCIGLTGPVYPGHMRPFVFFQFFDFEESYTRGAVGADPVYDESFKFEVSLSDEVKRYLDKEALEFIVFDDNAPVRQGGVDSLGSARVPLSSLLLDTAAEGTYPLFAEDGRETGAISLRVGWRDSAVDNYGYGTPLTQVWEEDAYERIASGLRDRGLDLKTAFNIFDQDQDGIISPQEFRNTLLITLRMPLSEQEIQLLINACELLDGGITKSIFRKKLGKFLYKGTEVSEAWESKALESIKNRVKEKGLSSWQTFQAFDLDKDGIIKPQEFKKTLHIMQLGFSEAEINKLYKYFDPQNTGRIDYRSFCERLQSSPQEESQGVLIKVGNLIKESRMSLLDAFRVFDENLDGKISSLEFTKVFQMMKLGLSDGEIQSLWNSLEKDLNGYLEYQVFCTMFQSTPEDKRSLKELRQHIHSMVYSNNINVAGVFSSFDKNMNGYLNRNEFREAIESLRVNLNTYEIETLLGVADINKDGKISIQEFVEFIEPSQHIERVFRKLLRTCGVSIQDLYNMIDSNQDGFITKEEFNKLMRGFSIPLTSSETNKLFQMLDSNKDGRLNIREFLSGLERKPEQPREYPREEKPRTEETKDVVKDVVQSIIDSRINLHDAFKTFDKNDDGYISRYEFTRVFQDMKLGLSMEQIESIRRRLDTSADERISYQEFKNLFQSYGVEVKPSATHKKLRTVPELVDALEDYMQNHRVSLVNFYTNVFDKNRDNWISREELKRGFNRVLLNPLTESEINELIKELCPQGQTRVNFNMIRDLVSRFSKKSPLHSLESSRIQVMQSNESLEKSLRDSRTFK